MKVKFQWYLLKMQGSKSAFSLSQTSRSFLLGKWLFILTCPKGKESKLRLVQGKQNLRTTSPKGKLEFPRWCKKCNLFTQGAPRSSGELIQKCLCIPGLNWMVQWDVEGSISLLSVQSFLFLAMKSLKVCSQISFWTQQDKLEYFRLSSYTVPLPFHIPFWQERYLFDTPFIEKRYGCVPLSHT